jgi:hypothetical protein
MSHCLFSTGNIFQYNVEMVEKRKVTGFSLLLWEVFNGNRSKYGSIHSATVDTGKLWDSMGPEDKQM